MGNQFVRKRNPAPERDIPIVTIRPRNIGRRARDPDTFLPRPQRWAPAPPQQIVMNDPRYPASNNLGCRHVKLLGEGGQGRCDLFRRTDGMLYVRKLMKHSVEVTSTNKPKEAKILQDILGPHPRIIQMFHYTWSPKETLFYLEYCSGGDLAMITKEYSRRNTNIPESFVWHAYIQLAEALAYLHEGYNRTRPDRKAPEGYQSIVHRDIKPHNVFLQKAQNARDYPDIVLADFGLATRQLYTSQFPHSHIMGTLAYQGPEIPFHSRSGDRWAMGACIHHMCVGNPPISSPPYGVDPVEHAEDARSREVTPLTYVGYSRELDAAANLVLLEKPLDRIGGRDLVLAIEDEHNRWKRYGHGKTPLASWALPR